MSWGSSDRTLIVSWPGLHTRGVTLLLLSLLLLLMLLLLVVVLWQRSPGRRALSGHEGLNGCIGCLVLAGVLLGRGGVGEAGWGVCTGIGEAARSAWIAWLEALLCVETLCLVLVLALMLSLSLAVRWGRLVAGVRGLLDVHLVVSRSYKRTD